MIMKAMEPFDGSVAFFVEALIRSNFLHNGLSRNTRDRSKYFEYANKALNLVYTFAHTCNRADKLQPGNID